MSSMLNSMNSPHDMEEEVDERHYQVESVLEETDDHEVMEEMQPLDNMAEEEEEEENVIPKTSASDEKTLFKMLTSDNVAGAIIGKSGKTISDLQTESNARIKVSQAADFYPGTNERIVLMTGPVYAVIQAQGLIWEKIAQFSKPRGSNFPMNQDGSNTVTGKVLIPSDAGGLIIGRGGNTIKLIQEESGARMQISPKDEMESKISKERILTISGSLGSCAKCTELIILKLQEDSSASYHNKTTSYGRSFGFRNDGINQQFQSSRFNLPEGAETVSATSTITINVPDAIIGYILGKRGSVISEIQHVSGAKVVVSPRNPREHGDDTQSEPQIRVVTISGSPSAAQTAQLLITQKLQLANAGSDGNGSDLHRR